MADFIVVHELSSSTDTKSGGTDDSAAVSDETSSRERMPTGYCMECRQYPRKKCMRIHNVILTRRRWKRENLAVEDNDLTDSCDTHVAASDQSLTQSEENSSNVKAVEMIRANYVGDMGVKSEKDEKLCCITGMALLCDERLVIADHNNYRLKVVELPLNEITAELELEAKPWDVTEICSGHLAVTLTELKKVVFIQSDMALKRGREIRVRGFCVGLDVFHDNKLVVSFIYPGKVEIVDMQGRALRVFRLTWQGGEFFTCPQNVVVCPTSQTIYVSDCVRHSVTHLRADGRVLGEYRDDDLKGPVQILIPKPGVVFVCGFDSRNIHVLTDTCLKLQLLPVNIEKLESPYSMCYSEETGRLYITVSCRDYMVIYELS